MRQKRPALLCIRPAVALTPTAEFIHNLSNTLLHVVLLVFLKIRETQRQYWQQWEVLSGSAAQFVGKLMWGWAVWEEMLYQGKEKESALSSINQYCLISYIIYKNIIPKSPLDLMWMCFQTFGWYSSVALPIKHGFKQNLWNYAVHTFSIKREFSS